MHAHVKNRLLTRFANRFFDLLFRLAHHLFDPAGVDASVRNQFFQRQPSDLTSDRVMPRNNHGLWRIVDDQIDPRRRFEGANITPLTANNFPFEFVIWQRKYGHRAFRDKITGETLDRQRNNLLALAHCLFFGFLFDDTNPLCRLMLRFIDHLVDEILLRFFPREASNLLELATCFVDLPLTFERFFFDIFFSRFERLISSAKIAVAFVDELQSFVDSFFFADQSFLLILKLPPSFPHLLFEFTTFLKHAILSLDLSLFLDRIGVFFRLLDDSGRPVFRDLILRACLLAANPDNPHCEENAADQAGNSKQYTLVQKQHPLSIQSLPRPAAVDHSIFRNY